jgi:hypothetical protein
MRCRGMGSDLVLQRHLQEQGLLDRFEARAIQWAEQAGIRWVELGGELWTLVSELERKKGVEPGDFTTNARPTDLSGALLEKNGEPPAALQRLLQVPGVKRASVPTAFRVEGGYALSCGGPGAREGITAMVRQQIPEWALAGYTLVNVPLALSYLMHGRSEVAKATRDLTIGTTIDVGRMAATKDNAPMAVIPFVEGGDPAVTALLLQAVQMMNANAQRAELKADHAQATAEAADQKAERALQLSMNIREAVLKPKQRQAIPQSLRQRVWQHWKRNFYLECPCCHKQVSGEQGTMHVDHFYNHSNELTNLWLVCVECNHRMGKPGAHRSALDRQRFATWQDRAGLQIVQMPLLGV